MNTQPTPDSIPGVGLSRRDVVAIARLRAEGHPWLFITEKLEILPEYHRDIDLLPLFHPDWADANPEAVRMIEEALFAEAQLVTRRQIRYAEKSKVKRAAIKRASRHRTRGGSRDRTMSLNPDGALAYRLERGETPEGIGRGYLAGLAGGASEPRE